MNRLMAGPTSSNTVGRRMAVAIRNSPLWLALLGLSLLSFGCATAPMLTTPAVIVPTPALKGVRIALVEFAPLPTTYPVGTKPVFPTLTGELYEEEKVVTGPEARTSSGEETVVVRTFVPRDYQIILAETVLLAMQEKGMVVQIAPTVAAAQQGGEGLIVTGVVKEFKYIGGQADIQVSVLILSALTGVRLWEGEFHSTATHTAVHVPNAVSWQLLEIGEASFHPLRALLALAGYNLAAQLVERLGQTVTLSGEPRR